MSDLWSKVIHQNHFTTEGSYKANVFHQVFKRIDMKKNPKKTEIIFTEYDIG
jgi:hypothetical protein